MNVESLTSSLVTPLSEPLVSLLSAPFQGGGGPAPIDGAIVTDDGDQIVTDDGDPIVEG